MVTGLFIGAGASYEAGMPLVRDVTAELRHWLTPEKLRAFNQSWRSQGGGHPDAVIDDFARVLVNQDLHYEALLGYIETQFRRPSPPQQHYHGLYSWLVEMVYWILYFRHTNNPEAIERRLSFYSGLLALVSQNHPLWIFSLNHDLILECFAAKHGLRLSAGFTGKLITLPRRTSAGVKFGELRAETITGKELESGPMSFLPPKSQGINLLKIHGALDVFTFREGNDLLRVIPDDVSVAGVIAALRAANEDLLYADGSWPGGRVKATNEVAYSDDQGEMQFLRRSLLASAFKFDKRSSQVLPPLMLDHFRSNINYVDMLVCIGYGFADLHINAILRDWLEVSSERRLEIVDPSLNHTPAFLLHLAPQVTLVNSTATEYFDRIGVVSRTKRELLEKRLVLWVQRQGDSQAAYAQLQGFLQASQRAHVGAFAETVKTLPLRDGDVDLEALGLTREEFLEKYAIRTDTPEELLESFLKTHGG